MWLENIENKQIIKSIYKNKIPNINQVCVKEFNISTSESLTVILKFDIKEMPDDIPYKWKENEVNTIEVILSFINTEIKYIYFNNINYKTISLNIDKLENGLKNITGKDNLGELIFELEANWVYIKNIIGYHNTQD